MSYHKLEVRDVVNYAHEHQQGSLYHPYQFGVVTGEIASVETDSGVGRLLIVTTDRWWHGDQVVDRFLELPEDQQVPFRTRSAFLHWCKGVVLHPDGKLHWAGHFYGLSHHGNLDEILAEMASFSTPRTKYAVGGRWLVSFKSNEHPELNCSRTGKVLFHAKYSGSGEHLFFEWESQEQEPLLGRMTEANSPGGHGRYLERPACEVYRQNFGGWKYRWGSLEFTVELKKLSEKKEENI